MGMERGTNLHFHELACSGLWSPKLQLNAMTDKIISLGKLVDNMESYVQGKSLMLQYRLKLHGFSKDDLIYFLIHWDVVLYIADILFFMGTCMDTWPPYWLTPIYSL